MDRFTFVVALCAVLFTVDGTVDIDEEADFMAKMIQITSKVAADPKLKSDYERRVEELKNRDYQWGPPVFNCNTDINKEPAQTVHELGPTDIKVVAAMGDSVTAGFGVGADNLIEVLRNNRGESWSIGGQKSLDNGVITISNVMRKFNPDLIGHSLCVSGPLSSHGWLNVAVGGATNRNMPGQADDVIDICAADDRIDNDNDWKVITLFVGGNDLCASCNNPNYNSTNYRARIEEALDKYHASLPRALVNLVPMFDITPLGNFSDGIFCELYQQFVCQCGMADEHRPNVRNTQLEYYEQLKELVDSGKYDTRDDFTVVLQPMLVDLIPPIDPDTGLYDKSFLSHDCFHPSLKAHQIFAYALWNTMLIPVADKPLEWDLYEPEPTFYCPTEDNPYFGTRLNGGAPTPRKPNVHKRQNENKINSNRKT